MSRTKKHCLDSFDDCPEDLNEHPFYGVTLSEEQLNFVNQVWNQDKLIVFCNSKAGTGKTFCATGVANLLVKYGRYDGIVYIVSPYGETKQGYLPGDITQKSEVYFEPFYQALIACDINPNTAISNESMVNQKLGMDYITCLTNTFLRGTNFNKKVIILDEAQNNTVSQLKTILTRCSDDCKVIVIGHDQQCDLENPMKSGFVKYLQWFDSQNDNRVAICNLTTNFRGWISRVSDELI